MANSNNEPTIGDIIRGILEAVSEAFSPKQEELRKQRQEKADEQGKNIIPGGMGQDKPNSPGPGDLPPFPFGFDASGRTGKNNSYFPPPPSSPPPRPPGRH